MDISKVFEACQEIEPFSENAKELLKRIMAISSPMDFDNEFATDEQLEFLVSELNRFNTFSRISQTLQSVIRHLPAVKTSSDIFI